MYEHYAARGSQYRPLTNEPRCIQRVIAPSMHIACGLANMLPLLGQDLKALPRVKISQETGAKAQPAQRALAALPQEVRKQNSSPLNEGPDTLFWELTDVCDADAGHPEVQGGQNVLHNVVSQGAQLLLLINLLEQRIALRLADMHRQHVASAIQNAQEDDAGALRHPDGVHFHLRVVVFQEVGFSSLLGGPRRGKTVLPTVPHARCRRQRYRVWLFKAAVACVKVDSAAPQDSKDRGSGGESNTPRQDQPLLCAPAVFFALYTPLWGKAPPTPTTHCPHLNVVLDTGVATSTAVTLLVRPANDAGPDLGRQGKELGQRTPRRGAWAKVEDLAGNPAIRGTSA